MKLPQRYIKEPNYYLQLNLPPTATALEVESTFKTTVQEIDLKNQIQSQRLVAAEKMLSLTSSYEILSDPIQRSHYDIRTFGRAELPSTEQIMELFKAGMKAYRKKRLDLALRYMKEVTRLYPHRSLYRVHLAIIYAEKEWFGNTENELYTALKLDPEDRFAKETVARLLFAMDSNIKTQTKKGSLVKRVGTGLLSLVKTAPLDEKKTKALKDKHTRNLK